VVAAPARRVQLEADIAGWCSRIYQIETWGDRVTSKLSTRVDWQLDFNGPQTVRGEVGGTMITETPWHTRFWFGGWDGDLLIGYVRGTLAAPFVPRAAR